MREEHYQNHVQGMLCRQCEEAVCLALNSQRGVLSSKSSFVKGSVDVTYDAGITGPAEIEAALLAAGYPVGRKMPRQYAVELLFLAVVLGLFVGLKSLRYVALPDVETGASLWMVFLAGLLTGTHCVSMCGGIALGLSRPRSDRQGGAVWKNVLPYHAGRLIICVILGAVFGRLGGAFAYGTKAKSMVFTLLGLAMIVVALRMWGIFPWLRELDALIPSFCQLPSKTRQKISGRALLVGLFTGVMPCGASYAMWLYAASAGSAAKGAAVMGVWCLGTMPLLLGLCLAGQIIPAKYGKWMNLANIMLILLFGGSMALSGLQMLT